MGADVAGQGLIWLAPNITLHVDAILIDLFQEKCWGLISRVLNFYTSPNMGCLVSISSLNPMWI